MKVKPNKQKNKFIYPFKQTTVESCFHIAEKEKEKRKLFEQEYVLNLTWLHRFEQKTVFELWKIVKARGKKVWIAFLKTLCLFSSI